MQHDGGYLTYPKPAAIRNLFKRGEPLALCKVALAEAPYGLTTRALGVMCHRTRGLDQEDPVLIRALMGVLSNALKKAARRREMERVENSDRASSYRLSA